MLIKRDASEFLFYWNQKELRVFGPYVSIFIYERQDVAGCLFLQTLLRVYFSSFYLKKAKGVSWEKEQGSLPLKKQYDYRKGFFISTEKPMKPSGADLGKTKMESGEVCGYTGWSGLETLASEKKKWR